MGAEGAIFSPSERRSVVEGAKHRGGFAPSGTDREILTRDEVASLLHEYYFLIRFQPFLSSLPRGLLSCRPFTRLLSFVRLPS